MKTVLQRLNATIAAVAPIHGVTISDYAAHTVTIQFNGASAGQITAANNALAAFDWTTPPDLTYLAQLAKVAAQAGIDDGELQSGGAVDRAMVSVVLMALDEFNLHALKIKEILDAVDAATSLADLKSRVAAIADHPQRTKQQLYNAVKSKIAGTAE